jgi:hypothetical protein
MRLRKNTEAHTRPAASAAARVLLSSPISEIRLCIPDDERHLADELPAWALEWPESAPLPRNGDVIYLTSTSAWGVSMVIHERLSRDVTRIEVWLSHVGASRHHREPGTALQ